MSESDEKTTLEEIEALQKALEVDRYVPSEIASGVALKIHDQTELAKKYLTQKTIDDLSRESRTQTVMGRDGSPCRSIYFCVTTRKDNIEKGVELISQVINQLSADSLIESRLAPISSLGLFGLPMQIATAAVFCFVHVPVDKIEEIKARHNKYWVEEGGVGPCIDDIKAPLEDGEFFAEIRITTFLASKIGTIDKGALLQSRIDQFLTVLPKGTVVKSVKQCDVTDLCIPYEVKFYNPLLKQIKQVETEYVRCAEIVDGKLEQFNLLTGIKYMDADGKKLYDY